MEIAVQTLLGLRPPSWGPAEAAARRLLAAAGRPRAEVSVLLVDDATIRALNRQWRHQDRPTDVLSWPQEEGGGPAAPGDGSQPDVLGDVMISLDTAERQ